MAVIKNMMVRAGADFSAFTTQAKRASSSMKGMQSSVTKSCNAMKKAVSGVSKVLGILGMAISVNALISAAMDAADAYDQQAEAEIKLATVMRNTMNARNSEIQGILDLCTAQQKLGVIGDEAQIAGAQELATYLSMSDSLKTLIPVMNDMAAQQYGWNASAEQCTQIATMLGKVMEGQTGALRRYGYYFTEAEEAILKTGTESERCALLAKIVTDSVGGMNHALAQTPSGRMRQLANALGDIKEQFGQCIRAIGVLLLPLLWKVAEVLQTIATWANRAVNSIAKVFGYASLLTGWQDVGTGVTGLSDDWEDLTGSITGAGKAAAEAKRKMLGFDELNVLGGSGADKSGGSGAGGGYGGSGGSGAGTGKAGGILGGLQDMLGAGDDGDLPWLTKLLYKVKDHLGLIKDMAVAAGAGFLTWNLLKGTDLGLPRILGLVAAVYGAVLEVRSGLRAWTEGVNFDNLWGMLNGATTMTLGLGAAFGKAGLEAGLLVGGLGLLVVGCKDWITTGQLTNESLLAIVGGFTAVMGAITLMTGSFIPLLIAAVVGGVLLIVKNWDAIVATLDNIKAKVVETATNVKTTIQTHLSAAAESISTKMGAAKDAVVAAWSSMQDRCTSIFSSIKGTIITTIAQATAHLMGVSWVGIGSSLMQGFLSGLRSKVDAVLGEVADFGKRVTSAVKNVLGIHSPSTVFADIGQQMDAGLIVGLRSGMPDVMSEMGDMTAALENSINPQIASPDGLASGYMAQGGGAEIGSDSDTLDGILAYVMQMFEWLQNEGGRPYVGTIDGEVLFQAMVQENNRAIRRTGASPIRT